MGSVEILPDLVVYEKNIGSRVLGGGAVSSLAALNDANDTTYIRAGGTIYTPWSALFRFAVPTLPAGAVVESVQSSIRYSKFQQTSGGVQEKIEAISILIGRLSGGKHSFYGFTMGYKLPSYKINSVTVYPYNFPHRDKNYDGKSWLWQLLAKPQARLYGSIGVARHWAWNLAQVHAFKLIVHYSEPPAVTLQEPSGTESVSRPQAEWTYSDNDGHSQAMYEMKIFSSAVATSPAFSPDTSPYVWKQYAHTSDEFATIARSLSDATYYAYVRVAERLLAGKRLWSAWASQSFTVDVGEPTAPVVTATYDAAVGGIKVAATTAVNKVTWHVSSHEQTSEDPGVVGGWAMAIPTGGGIGDSTAFALDGSHSLRMFTTTTGGAVHAITPSSGGYPIVGGQTYSYLGSIYSPVSVRAASIEIHYYDVNGAVIGSSVVSGNTNTVVGAWTQVAFTHTAPANATKARFRFRIAAMGTNESHYLDQVGLFPGTTTTWGPGGWLNDDFGFDLERSLDGGVTWTDVPAGVIDFDRDFQRIDFTDYEVPSVATATYRARVNIVNQAGEPYASPYAQDDAVMGTLTDWWLREVGVRDGAALKVKVRSIDLSWEIPHTRGFPLDSSDAIVTTSGVKTENLSVVFHTLVKTDYDALISLLKSEQTLLLKDVVGRQWYVKPVKIDGEMLRAYPESGSPYPVRHAHILPVEFISVGSPRA